MLDHPLVQAKLTALRDETTDSAAFARLADELMLLMAYEATRHLNTVPATVRTPLAPADGCRLSDSPPILIPVLRAGLGMLAGMRRILPTATVGFLGVVRSENATGVSVSTYANRLPDDLTGRQVFLLDPMLATGESIAVAIEAVIDRGATDICMINLLVAPEGVTRLRERFDDSGLRLQLVTAAVDDGLTPSFFITPGLGDAGDRLFGDC